MSQYRKDRVAQEVRRIVGNALLTEVKDPRLAFVSLTGAKISADLSISHIYWLTSSELPHDEIQKALEKATPFRRKVLAEHLTLRRIPNLVFHYDEAFERGARMSELLDNLRKSGQMGPDDDAQDSSNDTSLENEDEEDSSEI